LFAVGDPDTNVLAAQNTGAATTGRLTFNLPARPGQFEFRYFLSDGVSKAATSNSVTVQ
jgi:hypothetical protein